MKLILLLVFGIFTSFTPTKNPELTIKITNIEKIQGDIKIGIFNTDKNFLKEGAAIKNYSIKVTSATAYLKITDLPAGDYAVSMYHDENSDNECNSNFIGIPKEAFGFSNNVRPKMSAPKYDECKFNLSEDKAITVKLMYF